MAKTFKEYYLKAGSAYYGMTKTRKMFALAEYHFFLAAEALKDPAKLLHKDFCYGPLEIKVDQNQELGLFLKAALKLLFDNPLDGKTMPFPKETVVELTTVDTGGTKKSKSITVENPALPLIVSYNSKMKGYAYSLKFTAKPYFNVTDKELKSQADLSALDYTVKSLFGLTDMLTLEKSGWDVKQTGDFSNTDNIITKFAALKAPLEIKLEPDWLYLTFRCYNYTSHTLEKVKQLLLIDREISAAVKATANLYKNELIHLPRLELGKGKSYRDSAADVKLKFDMPAKYNARMPKTWESQLETHEEWRLQHDGKREMFKDLIKLPTAAAKPFYLHLVPGCS
jgi:hypothetical protein